MDPNATLEDLRWLVERVHNEGLSPEGYERLANAFEDLDRWLSKGGFLPADWQGRKSG